MAFENVCCKVPGLTAAADLSTAQYKFVKLTAAEQVNIATSLGEAVVGVLQNKPAGAGHAAEIAVDGSVSKVLAGAPVTAGAYVTTDATARAVAAGAGENRVGLALNGAGAAGQLISVLLGNKGHA